MIHGAVFLPLICQGGVILHLILLLAPPPSPHIFRPSYGPVLFPHKLCIPSMYRILALHTQLYHVRKQDNTKFKVHVSISFQIDNCTFSGDVVTRCTLLRIDNNYFLLHFKKKSNTFLFKSKAFLFFLTSFFLNQISFFFLYDNTVCIFRHAVGIK